VYTITERIQIAWKWLLSFVRSEWGFDDYPLRVRRNQVDDPSIAWMAQFLNWGGPGGLGATPEAAVENFRSTFAVLVKYRREAGERLPRPGTGEPLKFASSSRVNADPALLEQFIQNVLGFGLGDPVFISDASSLLDFGDEHEVERLLGLIRSNFGVDATHLQGPRISEILEYVTSHRANSTGESDARKSGTRLAVNVSPH
jgi:hypothetical protein